MIFSIAYKDFDKFKRIPVGLWHELKNMCEQFDYELEIEGFEQIYDYDFDPVDFENWVVDFKGGKVTICENWVDIFSHAGDNRRLFDSTFKRLRFE